MDLPLGRREILFGASGVAASLCLPALSFAKSPFSPERSLEAYSRVVVGAEGDEVLWWFIGDIYLYAPGQAVTPVARALTIARYNALKSTPRSFRHRFHEVGAFVDLDTGEPLMRNPFTGAALDKSPALQEPDEEIEWAVQDDGGVVRTAAGRTSAQVLRWTQTPANLLLVETDRGASAVSLAPGDASVGWKAPEATRTFYAKTASLARPGFVPAQSTYDLVLKATPPWLASPASPGDHFLIVRGVGQKSRPGEVVNPDALDLVRRFYPKFI